jgi:hypothetical protein
LKLIDTRVNVFKWLSYLNETDLCHNSVPFARMVPPRDWQSSSISRTLTSTSARHESGVKESDVVLGRFRES